MQWLNKIDEILDSVLQSGHGNSSTTNEVTHDRSDQKVQRPSHDEKQSVERSFSEKEDATLDDIPTTPCEVTMAHSIPKVARGQHTMPPIRPGIIKSKRRPRVISQPSSMSDDKPTSESYSEPSGLCKSERDLNDAAHLIGNITERLEDCNSEVMTHDSDLIVKTTTQQTIAQHLDDDTEKLNRLYTAGTSDVFPETDSTTIGDSRIDREKNDCRSRKRTPAQESNQIATEPLYPSKTNNPLFTSQYSPNPLRGEDNGHDHDSFDIGEMKDKERLILQPRFDTITCMHSLSRSIPCMPDLPDPQDTFGTVSSPNEVLRDSLRQDLSTITITAVQESNIHGIVATGEQLRLQGTSEFQQESIIIVSASEIKSTSSSADLPVPVGENETTIIHVTGDQLRLRVKETPTIKYPSNINSSASATPNNIDSPTAKHEHETHRIDFAGGQLQSQVSEMLQRSNQSNIVVSASNSTSTPSSMYSSAPVKEAETHMLDVTGGQLRSQVKEVLTFANISNRVVPTSEITTIALNIDAPTAEGEVETHTMDDTEGQLQLQVQETPSLLNQSNIVFPVANSMPTAVTREGETHIIDVAGVQLRSQVRETPKRLHTPNIIIPTFNIVSITSNIDSSSTSEEVDGSATGHLRSPAIALTDIQQRTPTLINASTVSIIERSSTFNSLDVTEISAEPAYFQAQSFRAAMGDLDYGREDINDDDNELDDYSSSSEKESEDYLVDSQTVTWTSDISREPDAIESSTVSQVSPISSFHPTMNRYGIVHIRLIRVQQLPCSPDTAVQAIISLPPWKGRIRTNKGYTYKGPSKAGTCFRWDENQRGDKEQRIYPQYFSMIHAYNNEDTPVPTISIDLKDLSYQMFEKDICCWTLACEPLMSNPLVWRRRWCYADTKIASNSPSKSGRDVPKGISANAKEDKLITAPIILLEACFEPTRFSETQIVLPPFSDACTEEISRMTSQDNRFPESPKRNYGLSESLISIPNLAAPTLIGTRKALSSAPHLFRVVSSWRPAYCSVCTTAMGLWFRYHQCETCGLDCCCDCQLRVDLVLPCGSDEANAKVEEANSSKFSVKKLMAVLAPTRDDTKDDADIKQVKEALKPKDSQQKGIGTLTVRIVKAVLLRRSLSPEVDRAEIWKLKDRWPRVGDHYVRISWMENKTVCSKRTKTILQSSCPIFESDEITIPVFTYGTEYLLEVLDSNTDKAVGSALLTTQGVLQWQRDDLAISDGINISSILSFPRNHGLKLRTLELRNGIKNGFGLDFYNSGRISDTIQAGEVTGLIDLEVKLHENPDLFSFSNPLQCPYRQNEDFNIDLIQIHIARISALLVDINSLAEAYAFLISWDNRALTSLSLLIFVATCMSFNFDYIGSLPCFVLLITLMYLRKVRRRGDFMMRWIKKEVHSRIEEENKTAVQYDIYRAVGTLEISVSEGKCLYSQHGIPGTLVVDVMFEPARYLDEKMKSTLSRIDPSMNTMHYIGTTESSGVTTHPKWHKLILSDECIKLQNFIPGSSVLSDVATKSASMDTSVSSALIDNYPSMTVPILQPITHQSSKVYNRDGVVVHTATVKAIPWESSPAALIFQVRFSDVLNKSLFDEKLGEIVLPLKQLVISGQFSGWCRVRNGGPHDANTSMTELKIVTMDERSGQDCNEITPSDTLNEIDNKNKSDKLSDEVPSIYIKAKLTIPPCGEFTSDFDKELSIAIAEENIRASNQVQSRRLGIIGSSLSTITTVRGVGENVLYLQNQLGTLLDFVEIIRNLFNFACPERSMLILILVFFSWLLLILIPTRIVILSIGLAQYATTFIAAFGSSSNANIVDTTNDDNKLSLARNNDPVFTWIMNFLHAVPTDEDLRRYYFWQARCHSERASEALAAKRRAARLTKLWHASWFGSLELRVETNSGGKICYDWEHIFAIILGHRFLWWRSEKHFDQGDKPLGRIFFAGHSGLSGLSPLELRQLKKFDLSLVVSIFGRGDTSQMKITVMTPDLSSKCSLEDAVLNACNMAKVD